MTEPTTANREDDLAIEAALDLLNVDGDDWHEIDELRDRLARAIREEHDSRGGWTDDCIEVAISIVGLDWIKRFVKVHVAGKCTCNADTYDTDYQCSWTRFGTMTETCVVYECEPM